MQKGDVSKIIVVVGVMVVVCRKIRAIGARRCVETWVQVILTKGGVESIGMWNVWWWQRVVRRSVGCSKWIMKLMTLWLRCVVWVGCRRMPWMERGVGSVRITTLRLVCLLSEITK